METTSTNVMVALLPTETGWCEIDCPHMTLVYIGEVGDLKPTDLNKITKTASDIAQLSKPIFLKVTGVEEFGKEEKVDVLRLAPTPVLIAIRSFFEIWDNGDFPDYKPHATIGPAGKPHENLPMFLVFDRILVGWGDTQFLFKFDNS